MTILPPIIGIDIRLIGQERTGDEVVFFHLTRALLKKGEGKFRFRLFTHEVRPEKLADLHTRLECTNRTDVEIVSLPLGRNRFLWNMVALPWELFRYPADIYHTQYIAPLLVPRHTQLVTHIHDVSFAAHPEWIAWRDRFFLGLLIPRSLRRSDAIVAPSRFTQGEIERYYPATRGKVVVVANAVGEEWFDPVSPTAIDAVRTRYQLPKRYIIASGTMQPRKNIPLLIQAWNERPEALQEVGLVLTGNPLGHHVDIELTRLPTQGICFTGYVSTEELRALMAGAEVLAFPSLYEGFGIPLLEAFASGTPVLASHIPPFQEVGGAALASFHPTSLAEAKKTLYSLLVDDEQQKRLVELGRQCLAAFSWAKSADEMILLYQKLVSSKFQ